MSEDDKRIPVNSDTLGPSGTTETPPEEQGLKKQLEELKQKQDTAAAAEANYAGLEKLIEEAKKAEEDYAKVYSQLQIQETRLKSERDALSNALQAVLGNEGIAAVEAIVTGKVEIVSEAESIRDAAKVAVRAAQDNVDEATEKMAALQADLDMWRKPVASIGKRLNVAEGLIEEIKKLRNPGGRGQAYWKLALGGHADVPGQEFLNAVLDREPEVIKPEDLRDKIRKSWDEFRTQRTKVAEANTTLADAQDELKQKEADFTDKSKNLIKAIAEALAERESASDAA